MIMYFTVDSGAKIALENLLKSGLYRDASEAICVSLINYDVIQREAQHNARVQISRADLFDDKSPLVHGSNARPPNLQAANAEYVVRGQRIPDIFRLPKNAITADQFPPAADGPCKTQLVGPKHWLFGQYNKLLPVKVTLRGVLNLLASHSDGVPVAEATRTISTEAWVLGDYFDNLDEKNGASRENALATAFPTTRGSGSPGQSRFANQFVVSVNAEGIATGLPIALKFAAYVDEKTPRVILSREGANFALLENPLLDQESTGQTKFSPAEVSFLVDHILKHVPEERSAFKIILGALSDGATTPKALDSFLSSNYADSTMTRAFLSLQRSGVISRLIDLQLVRRLREGTRVTYAVAESAADLLREISAAEAESIKKSS
jgi:hypothetical protein